MGNRRACVGRTQAYSSDVSRLDFHISNFRMSWQSYVDDQLLATGMVTAAAIAGHDGSIWAKSGGFNCSPDEVKKILGSWDNTSAMGMNGVTVNGLKYMFLSANDKVVRGKKGSSGVHICKTTQAVIVSTYKEPVVPEQCANATEKLGDYLISVGY